MYLGCNARTTSEYTVGTARSDALIPLLYAFTASRSVANRSRRRRTRWTTDAA